MELVGQDGDRSGVGNEGGREGDRDMPRENEKLKKWGSRCLTTVLQGWWQCWRSRRNQGDPIMEMLSGAAKRGQGIRPEGQVKEWLRGYGCEDEVLDAAGTERWLGNWPT